MMLNSRDLDAYFKRIGYEGPATPTLATLRNLQHLQPLAIPFENLDSWRGLPVSLKPEAVFRKLVHDKRGGYCFEQNQLLMRVLQSLGFPVSGLSARVLWMQAGQEALPRTHKALLVNVDGEQWIADAGFGGQTMTAPLRLASSDAQQSPHGLFTVTRNDELYRVAALVADQWQPLYECSLDAYLPVDYETANWYVSTHPQSRFVNHLICSRVDASGRHVLLDTHYSHYRLDAAPESRNAATPEELRSLLQTTFGIGLDELQDLEPKLASLFS